ncbi:MAG: hypothetical protein JWO71_1044 [Candidatus Acidoferrum typicum]|nr:hypothetical protein [Candidatus Acidoferrum typicum]
MSRWGASLLVIVSTMVAVGIARAATEDVKSLQTRFDRETNSVHKAKLLEKLGDAQLDVTRRASQANDYKTIGLVMEKYRDNARAAVDALKKDHPDAERHTSGFKQLQIHVHKSLREVDEVLVVAPDEYRPPLEIVRRDLANMDDELLELLFPRHPNEKKPAVKTSGGEGVSP